MLNRGTQRSWRSSMAGGRPRLLLTVVGVLLLAPGAGQAQESPDSNQRSIQIVHASPATGPVDVYIDGAIVLVGLNFGAVSDSIVVATGERALELVPSGRSRDDALVEAAVALEPGAAAHLALIGPVDDLRIGVYPVDLSPLPPNLTRIGAVLGTVDTGPVDLAVTGGDVLFPTIEFTGATEFADVVAGTYDLEVRYGGTDTPIMALPGTVLAPGQVYTLYVVGESALGELQPLFTVRAANSVMLAGHPAWIQTGDCTSVDVANTVADLTIVAVSPFSEPSGHPDAAATESSFTTIGLPYASLVDQPHAIVVAGEAGGATTGAACGEIGGTQTIDGSLVVGVRALPGSTTAGIAVLAPNILDLALTDVSVFVADGLFATTSSSAPGVDQPEATPTPIVIESSNLGESDSPAATPQNGD